MTQTEILFAQSEFALASYAKNLFFGISDSAYQTALEDGGKGMSQSQAVTFIENWRVLDQYTDPTSGLSATIFQKTAGGPRYLAIRGTEASGSDVAADGILALGIPSGLNPQFAALKTKLETEWLAEGGPLYNQNFTVSGHSLGGYLAAAVKQQYGAQVTDAYLFNAPGVGGLFGNLADALTGALGLSGAPVGNIWNVRGSEGFPFIAGLGSQLGTAVSVQIEAASGVGLNNHSIVGLTDALAIQAVYARLAPSLTQSELNALIDASGDPMALTHESALDALRTLFAGTEAIPTGIDRDRYYSHLNALQDDSGYKALAAAGAQIVVLANLTIDQVKTLAQGSDTQGLATRYALKALNPFALVGANYAAFTADGALDLYNSETGIGDFTPDYVADRANFLVRKLWFSTEDRSPVNPQMTFENGTHLFEKDDTYFADSASGYIIAQGLIIEPTLRYLFGDERGNVLSGGSAGDRLYGGAGDDVLQGNGGNDYLEGGRDDDVLDGGADSDRLNGGTGYDTYLWNTGDGDDQIIDADRQGRILINGSGVSILIKQSATTWSTADGKITLTQGDTWKLAIDGGGSLDLGTEFNDGDYGIARTELATGGAEIKGDLDPILDGNGDLQYDAQGNVIVNAAIAAHGRIDTLHGTASADTIRSLAGNDVIEAGGGNDLAEGGSGNDIVAGQDGADTLWGDTALTDASPLATALANGDSDTSQTAKGDWIDGGAADDLLIGTAAQDLLSGGTGNDLLIAGAGDDLMLGDATIVTGSTDWQVSRFIENNATLYRWTLSQGTTTASDTLGGADVMYGGQGQDWLFGGAGDDLLDGGADDDVLFGEAGNDVLLGGTGDDVINGDRADLAENLQGSDWIDGGDGADRIWGMAGDDILIGGSGNDTIVGGAGRDTYIFNKGDGIDTLFDDDTGPEKSILVFGEGFDKDSIKLRKGSLLLDMGDGDAIHIENFDPENPLATQSFASFQFADGTSLTWEEMLAKGFDLDGSDGDDSIEGTGVADRLDGRAGNDTIWGLDGDDILTGGTGTDYLDGGLGDDSYIVHAGDAPADFDLGLIEAIVDQGGNDTLILDGIDPATVRATAGAAPNELRIAFGSDQMAIVDGIAGTVENFTLANETLTTAELIGRHAETVLTGTDAAGHALTLGGRRNDTLTALAGHATFSGGRGNDVLTGNGGNNTYLYSLGDGTDSLADTSAKTDAQGAAQLNTLKVGAGVTAQDLHIRAAEGVLILQIGADPDDAIHIQGFDPASQTGALDRIEFSDGTTLTYAELIARGSDIVGSAGDDILTGSVLHDRLIGGQGNDTYRLLNADDATDEIVEAEGQGIDTVESAIDHTLPDFVENLTLTSTAVNATGNALDNTLTGNALDNVLAGGEGSDTYRFARQSGNDLLIDSGANRIELDAGLAFADIAASRDGDDLLLAIRRDTGSVRVQGYFTDGTPWQVSDAEGNGSTTETLLADTAAYEEDRITTLARDFLGDTKDAIEQNLTAQGLARQANGTWARTTQSANNLSVTQTEEFTTTTYTGRFNNGVVAWTSTGTSQEVNWTQPGTAYRSQATASILQSRVSAGGAEVHALGGAYQYATQSLWAEVRWGAPQAGGTTSNVSQTLNTPWTVNGLPGTLDATYTYETVTTHYQGTLTDRYLAGPGVDQPPAAVAMQVDSTSQIYRLEEINLTDGDHVVHASAHSAVIGGTGDNTIHDAGFAYGGIGDSTIYNATHAYGGIGNARLIGGNLLVAGTGDQWLENGATMVVGDGHNTVVAGAGQVVQVGRDNVGRDLVLGQGDQTWNVLDAVYRAQYIYDWQEGYEHGGQYYLYGEFGQGGYYDSLTDLKSALAPWASLQDLFGTGAVRKIGFLPFLVEVPGSGLQASAHYAHTSVPVVTHSAADLAGLQPFHDSGDLVSPTLSFGAGIARGDLQFSWAEAVSPLDGSRRVALDIGWDQDQGIRVLAPRIVDPLGASINDFVFADGDRASLAELIALAPPAPDFDPDFFQFAAGTGAQSMGANDYPGISFNGGLTAADLTATRDGDDVVLSFGQGGDSLRIVGGRLGGVGIVTFDDATVWTWPGPGIGTPGDDILSDYHALYGQAGNDTLTTGAGGGLMVGGRGDDVYVVNRGDGAVTIDQSMGDDPFRAGGGDSDVIRFGAGIAPGDIEMSYSAELDTLTLGLGGDDAIHLLGWRDPGSRQVARYEFADGSVWTADSVPVVLGTDAADVLHGTAGKDTLLGRGGDDYLFAYAGDDALHGGSGDDTLTGGAGSDVYRFARGDGQDVVVQDGALHGDVDVVRFGAGIAPDDVVVSLGDNNGDLVLTLVDSDDILMLPNWFHPTGARVSAVEFADGEAWDKAALLSRLAPTEGTAGDDLLVSTPAHHVLNGGAGDDSYFVTADTPSTRIADEGGTDTLILDDANLADVSLGIGSLKISVNATGQEIHLDDFDPDNPYAAGGIEYFRFADGTFLTKAGLIDALGFHPTGTGGDDALSGTSLDDVITGLAGNDTLDGRGGSDILDGGSGDDSYLYAQGDGADRIVDEAGVDRIVFGPGILASEVLASLDGGEVVLSLSGADSIRFGANGPGSYAIEHVEFDDGISWQAADLLRQLSRTPPTADLPLADQVAAEDAVFRFAVPSESFADADAAAGDTLAYSAHLADGSPLPGWLAFDAATRTFEGTPGNADVGALAIELVATDGAGNSVSQSFGLTVANTNDAPIAAHAIADQSAAEGDAFSVAIPFDSFADVDAGDSLAYAVTLADGSALPAWLGFDPWTGILSGTPPGGAAGSLGLTVTATDLAGASAAGSFTLSVTGGNHAPELAVAIAAPSATQDLVFSYTVPAGSFTDSDPGDSLSFTATLADGTALPAWLAFDAATATFSGTPGASDPGVLALRVTATDSGGLSAQAEFDLPVGQHLRGTGGSDTMDYSASHFVGVTLIDGGAGRDTITGSAGDDVISGGAGADTLFGGAGDDIFLVTGTHAAYDRFEGGDGRDVLQGSAGDDTFRMRDFGGAATVERIDGMGGYDVIGGTGGADTLDFSATELAGIALIDGGAGRDVITGSAGDDVISGGAGADTLFGGAGNDTFLVSGTHAAYDRFEGGDGRDVLQGSAGDDTFRLRDFGGEAAIERIDGMGGYDVIAGTGGADTLDFSATELAGIALIDGGAGRDVITGSAGKDIIVGGTGSDTLSGGAGNDGYRLGRGDGVDTIVENDATPGNRDAAEFLAGIGREQIWLRHVGNNLEARIIGTSDKLIVQDWYLGDQYRVEEFRSADGGRLLDSQVENLVQAMAAFAPPGAGQTALPPDYQEALAPVIAANWQ